MRSRGCSIQRTEAWNLHREIGLDVKACGFPELNLFAMAPSLYDYQLLVVDETRSRRVFNFGPPLEKQLVLLYDGHHYDVITSLEGFFASGYFCGRCMKQYNDRGRHACTNNPDHCSACLQDHCADYVEAKRQKRTAWKPCHGCGRMFYGDTCFSQHQSKSIAGTDEVDLKDS